MPFYAVHFVQRMCCCSGPSKVWRACGKKKVLARKDVNNKDTFVFNDVFRNPHAKVYIKFYSNEGDYKCSTASLYSAIVDYSSSCLSLCSLRNHNAHGTLGVVRSIQKHYLDTAIVHVQCVMKSMKACKQLTYKETKFETVETIGSLVGAGPTPSHQQHLSMKFS